MAKRSAPGHVEGVDGKPVGPAGQQPRTAEEEIAARTADTDEKAVPRFSKVYVVKARDFTDGQDREPMHEANKVDMLQQALNVGLHPRGEATFDGHKPHADGQSTYLTYSVEVVPAVEDEVPARTVTPTKALRGEKRKGAA